MLGSLAIKDVFCVYITSSKQKMGLGEFEAAMQIQEAVKGLHDFQEFS